MGKLNYSKLKKFRNGSLSIKDEATLIAMADRWLAKKAGRIDKQRAKLKRKKERLRRELDASIPWERLDLF